MTDAFQRLPFSFNAFATHLQKARDLLDIFRQNLITKHTSLNDRISRSAETIRQIFALIKSPLVTDKFVISNVISNALQSEESPLKSLLKCRQASRRVITPTTPYHLVDAISSMSHAIGCLCSSQEFSVLLSQKRFSVEVLCRGSRQMLSVEPFLRSFQQKVPLELSVFSWPHSFERRVVDGVYYNLIRLLINVQR